MTAFWGWTVVLVAGALVFVLWPLLRKPGDPMAAAMHRLREQLRRVEQAHAEGLLDAEQFATRRASLQTEMAELLDGSAAPAGPQVATKTVVLLAVLLPLLTVALYQRFGSPNALLFAGVRPATASASAASTQSNTPDTQAPDLRQAASALEARLADRPNDVDGWSLLARTWQELGEFAKARDAWATVYAQRQDDPEVLADYAQALALSSDPRSLLGQPRELLERALALAPDHPRALWLYGYAQRQAGDLAGTLDTWAKLQTQMPAGSPEAASLVQQVNVVREELGQPALPVPPVLGQSPMSRPVDATPASAPTSAPRPEPGDTAAPAGAAGLAVRVSLDPALVARVQGNEVVFVMAKAEAGPPMPLAVQRISVAQLPFEVRLDDSMAMTPALTLSTFPRVVVSARVSRSGNAQASPGDLQGTADGVSQPHAGVVEVVIRDILP